MKRWVSIMNLCAAWNMSVFRSYENDLFPCNNKSILMSNMSNYVIDRQKLHKYYPELSWKLYLVCIYTTVFTFG